MPPFWTIPPPKGPAWVFVFGSGLPTDALFHLLCPYYSCGFGPEQWTLCRRKERPPRTVHYYFFPALFFPLGYPASTWVPLSSASFKSISGGAIPFISRFTFEDICKGDLYYQRTHTSGEGRPMHGGRFISLRYPAFSFHDE